MADFPVAFRGVFPGCLVRRCLKSCWNGGFLGLIAVFLVGCAPADGLKRVAVSGTVTKAGQPVAIGAVSLLPQPGNDGPAANASISNGRYEFTISDGPIAGPHRVLVTVPGGTFKGTLVETGDVKKSEATSQEKTAFESVVEIPDVTEFVHDIELK